jgi:hypothetical protein
MAMAHSAPGMLPLYQRVAAGEACIWRVCWSILPPAEWTEEVFNAGGIRSPQSVNGLPNSFDSKTGALRASWSAMVARYGKGGFSEKVGGFGFPNGLMMVTSNLPDGSQVRESLNVFQGVWPLFAVKASGEALPEAVKPAAAASVPAPADPAAQSPEEAIAAAIAVAAAQGNFGEIPALVAGLQSLRAASEVKASESAPANPAPADPAEASEGSVEAVNGNPAADAEDNPPAEEIVGESMTGEHPSLASSKSSRRSRRR